MGTGSLEHQRSHVDLIFRMKKSNIFLESTEAFSRTQKNKSWESNCIYLVVNYKQVLKGQGTVSLSISTVLGGKYARF